MCAIAHSNAAAWIKRSNKDYGSRSAFASHVQNAVLRAWEVCRLSRRKLRPLHSAQSPAARQRRRSSVAQPIPSGSSNRFGGFVASRLLAASAHREEIGTDLIAIHPSEFATAVSQAT